MALILVRYQCTAIQDKALQSLPIDQTHIWVKQDGKVWVVQKERSDEAKLLELPSIEPTPQVVEHGRTMATAGRLRWTLMRGRSMCTRQLWCT